MGYALTVLVVLLVILVHELGHYIAMRRNGVHVEVFSVGFGPVLWQMQLKNGTLLKLCLVPLGGYVQARTHGIGSMCSASLGARFRIFAAGMFFNASVAFVVAIPVFAFWMPVPSLFMPYVDMVGAPHWATPVIAAFVVSFGVWLSTPVILVKTLMGGVTKFLASTSGPIGIVTMGNSMVEHASTPQAATVSVLVFFIVLNGGIAGFNLLPIYPLDGGHMFELMLQKVAGRPIPKVIDVYRRIGTAIVLLLVAVIIGSDVLKTILPH